MKKIILLFLCIAVLKAQPKLLDDFNSSAGWKNFASEGVTIKTSIVDGLHGKAIKLEYNFTKGSGHAGIQKIIPINLPANYQFTFYLKAESPNNNLEFKLLDKSGENVWWLNQKNFEFPKQWKKISLKKRHISFAWGPASDHNLKNIDKIEFTISSYNGGKGTVYVDELNFEPLPETNPDPPKPVITVTSSDENHNLKFLTDNNLLTKWHSTNNGKQEITFDFKGRREYGGLKILWDEKDFAGKFSVLVSNDGNNWEKSYSVDNCRGGLSYVRLNEFESSYLKLELEKSSSGKGFGIKEVEIKNVDWSEDINKFFINIAKDFPRGYFPRYFYEEASYWTIVGVNADAKEALINEDGMIEVDKQQFSLEPFLFYDGKLRTWNDSENTQRLENNYLPIPVVTRCGNVRLDVKSFADGSANKSSVLYIEYKIKNTGKENKSGNFFVAVRPFQTNPYYQWLNITGGVAKINSIEYLQNAVKINGNKFVHVLTPISGFGASQFDEGDITSFISQGKLPEFRSAKDTIGFASAAMKFSFNLKPDEEKKILLAVPFYKNNTGDFKPAGQTENKKQFEEKFAKAKKFWMDKVNNVKFNLPRSADRIINTLRSNLAYILINRDDAGIQPGSRSYERSWIRDGSLTSSALLKNGIQKEVKEFINWYSVNQFENGKVPCVVDRRGPDPVPENDSNGEFIFLIKQYFNFTHDTTFLKSKYENVKDAVKYIEYMISQRTTDFYKTGNDSIKLNYGLVPESISHEGYSDKPRHSYWDNFWTLKGLKDATDIAALLNNKNDEEKFATVRDEFKKNLYNSIDLTVKYKKIDYIPGCTELGDFDATSTTIALYPCNEFNNVPKQLLRNTFDKYYNYFENRINPKTKWINFTPYEVRTIGSFIFMDEIDRAHEAIDFFLKSQKPQLWNQWAEVVWKDRRYPGYIGDMPHTWVGSDFINAIRTLFVYENDYDSSLVVGAGLYESWIDAPRGMSVEHLPTYYGGLSYSVNKENSAYTIKLYGNLKLPGGGIILKNFNRKKLPKNVSINGKSIFDFTNDRIVVKDFPATVLVHY